MLYLSQRGRIPRGHRGEFNFLTGEENMEQATTVLIADSADDFCSSLTAALRKAEGFQVVGIATDGE